MMTKITPPNFTQIPNVLIDAYMPTMKEAELKVVMAIARLTFGWHKKDDKISLSYLQEMTGLSRQGVLNGISDGMAHKLISRRKRGKSFAYRLLVNEVDHPLVNEVDRQIVNEVDTQKKEEKKEEKKRSSSRSGSKRVSPTNNVKPTGDDDFLKNSKPQIDYLGGDRDGKALIAMLQGSGWIVPGPTQTAMEIESEYTDAQIKDALNKTVAEHKKKIGSGQSRGITTPLSYMLSILAPQVRKSDKPKMVKVAIKIQDSRGDVYETITDMTQEEAIEGGYEVVTE